jgi:dihydroorotase
MSMPDTLEGLHNAAVTPGAGVQHIYPSCVPNIQASTELCLTRFRPALLQAGALDKLEAFASFNGPDFYGLPRNSGSITLLKQDFVVPASYSFGPSTVVPMWAGETLTWQVQQ